LTEAGGGDDIIVVPNNNNDATDVDIVAPLSPTNTSSSEPEVDHATELEFDDSSCTFDLMEDTDIII